MRLGAERLGRSLQESPRTFGLVASGVQEVGVVDPDIGRLGAKLLDDLLKEVIRFLLSRLAKEILVGFSLWRLLPCACWTGCRC